MHMVSTANLWDPDCLLHWVAKGLRNWLCTGFQAHSTSHMRLIHSSFGPLILLVLYDILYTGQPLLTPTSTNGMQGGGGTLPGEALYILSVQVCITSQQVIESERGVEGQHKQERVRNDE